MSSRHPLILLHCQVYHRCCMPSLCLLSPASTPLAGHSASYHQQIPPPWRGLQIQAIPPTSLMQANRCTLRTQLSFALRAQ